MKFETKKKKQLESVKNWASHARKYFDEYESPKISVAFYTLIAVEQLIKYLEMEDTK